MKSGNALPSESPVPVSRSSIPYGSLIGLGAGAVLMFFMDPQRGRRRRALVRDQVVHAVRRMEKALARW